MVVTVSLQLLECEFSSQVTIDSTDFDIAELAAIAYAASVCASSYPKQNMPELAHNVAKRNEAANA